MVNDIRGCCINVCMGCCFTVNWVIREKLIKTLILEQRPKVMRGKVEVISSKGRSYIKHKSLEVKV